jgi:hypothetical protein
MFGTNPIFALTCLGAVPLLWVVERRIFVWVGVAAAAIAAHVFAVVMCGPQAPYFAAGILSYLGKAGAVSAAVLAVLAVRRPSARLPLAIFSTVMLEQWGTGRYLGLTGTALPMTFDRTLFLMDGLFGFQPSFVLGRLFLRDHWVLNLSFLTYHGLLFVLMLLCAIQCRVNWKGAVSLMAQFTLVGVIGAMLYAILPVAGPLYAFHDFFPTREPSFSPADAVAGFLPPSPRNGMPSLHLTWALLYLLTSWQESRWLRLVCGVFLLGTILATMGLGEHYLLDLVIAVPFSVSMAMLKFDTFANLRRAFVPAVLMLSTVGWMCLIRFAPGILLSRPLLAAAELATVCVPVYVWFRSLRRGRTPVELAAATRESSADARR